MNRATIEITPTSFGLTAEILAAEKAMAAASELTNLRGLANVQDRLGRDSTATRRLIVALAKKRARRCVFTGSTP